MCIRDSSSIARVYHNNSNGTFSDILAGLPGLYDSSVARGDYDNDGRPDFLLSGVNYQGTSYVWVARIYHNSSPLANTAPSAPSDLGAKIVNGTTTFTWASASDTQTPAGGLSYN